MTKANPKISVIMLVYNARLFIQESVSSILHQTFGDFELLIFDDHSTDDTLVYLNSLEDKRIKIFTQTENRGLVQNLNRGLALASGEYIARMDGDDISDTTRFEKQVQFLEIHPEVICCGTGYIEIPSGKKSELNSTHDEIVTGLLDRSQHAHPTVMFRREANSKYKLEYDKNWELAEDYRLWTQMSFVGQLANLPEQLLQYRVHSNSYSSAKAIQQKIKAEQVAFEYAKTLSGNHPDTEQFSLLPITSIEDLEKYLKVEDLIKSAFEKRNIKNVRQALVTRRARIIKQSLGSMPLDRNAIKLLIKCRVNLDLKFYISYLLGFQRNNNKTHE